MLYINDLDASAELDRSAMATIRGGRYYLLPYYGGLFNGPTIDAGVHEAVQQQGVEINQSGALGGFNGVANHQLQNGVSGQAVGF